MLRARAGNWKFLPLVFGGISLCVIVIGLFVDHYLSNEYTRAIEINQKWTEHLDAIDDLQRYAGDVNAPGNDIFESKRPSHERKKFEAALRRFHVKLELTRINLMQEQAPFAGELDESISTVQNHMQNMADFERQIFDLYESGKSAESTQKMVHMDQEYSRIKDSILEIRKIIRVAQTQTLKQQKERGVWLRRQEAYFIAFLILISVFIAVYSSRLTKIVSTANHLLEQKRRALDAAAIVVIFDFEGKIIYVNDNFLRLSGYQKENIIGKSYRDVNFDESNIEKYNELWRTVSEKKIWRGEFKNRSKLGRVYWVNSTVIPMVDQTDHLENIVDIQFDITESKQVQADLLDAKTQAELAHATKARFLANMSHEIRTPMNGIIGMTSLLMGFTNDPVHLERLKIIQNCGNSLLDLINDVLDFSKLEVDKIELENEPFDLHGTAKEVVELLGTRASEKGILLTYTASPEVPAWIKGDVTRFRQILTNLVSNALKFTEKGGVKITSAAKNLGNKTWSVEFSVKDSGIGIAPELRDRLFQSFSQVDASTTRKFGGTGLGLVISKGLCEKMGGTIRLESEIGKGSTFFFSLKAEEVSHPSQRKQEGQVQEYDGNMGKNHPLRILVAEDNRTNQLVILGLLGKFGYQADIAPDGRQVVEMVERKTYDLILMDSHMPEMDGFVATREVIKKYKNSPRPRIISLSASTMKQDIDKCFESGMDGFIGKPITIPALVKTLSQCQPLILSSTYEKKAQKNMETDSSKIFDSKTFIERFAGLEDLAREAIDSFLQTLPDLLRDLEVAIDANDGKKIELAAHTIKGSVLNFCSETCRVHAFALEKMGRENNQSKESHLKVFAQLKEELIQLERELEKFKNHKMSA